MDKPLFLQLIQKSKAHHLLHQETISIPSYTHLFALGAEWMYLQLSYLRGNELNPFDVTIPFHLYGIFKYSLSLGGWILSIIVLYKIHPLLILLSIIVFYAVEIHFLFLFPLLIDNNEKPFQTSLRMLYKIGFLKTLINIIPIGCYMMIGLLDFKQPLRNWYIGCLSILFWYEEIRPRI